MGKLKSKIYLIFILFIWGCYISNISVANDYQYSSIVTINNLKSYKEFNQYQFWNQKGLGDYVHNVVRMMMMKWLSNTSNYIYSFKQLNRIDIIHTKIQRAEHKKLSQKIKSLLVYLDDLIYNYSDSIYKNVLTLHNKNIKSNSLNNRSSSIQQKDTNTKTFYDKNSSPDKINNNLLKEYMCSENYTKSIVDYGCWTTEPTDYIYKERLKMARYYHDHGDKSVSKYNYNEANILLTQNIKLNYIKNFLYKSAYLLSPWWFTYWMLFSKLGYNNNVYDYLWGIGEKNATNDNIFQEIGNKIMKILVNNNYRPYQYTRFKVMMKYLEQN